MSSEGENCELFLVTPSSCSTETLCSEANQKNKKEKETECQCWVIDILYKNLIADSTLVLWSPQVKTVRKAVHYPHRVKNILYRALSHQTKGQKNVIQAKTTCLLI